MEAQQILDMERRIAKLELQLEGLEAGQKRMELMLAEIKGAVSLMRLTLPLIIGIGGLTVAAITLFK